GQPRDARKLRAGTRRHPTLQQGLTLRAAHVRRIAPDRASLQRRNSDDGPRAVLHEVEFRQPFLHRRSEADADAEPAQYGALFLQCPDLHPDSGQYTEPAPVVPAGSALYGPHPDWRPVASRQLCRRTIDAEHRLPDVERRSHLYEGKASTEDRCSHRACVRRQADDESQPRYLYLCEPDAVPGRRSEPLPGQHTGLELPP